jgi:plastocyanin
VRPGTRPVGVNPDGSLPNVLVYVETGLEGRRFEPPATPAVLDQVDFQFVPRVLAVVAGQTLRIRSSDSAVHNVHGTPARGREINVMLQRGDHVDWRLDAPEVVVPIVCDIHPSMRAFVAVLPHPYAAVSDGDGRFEIRGLPAQTLE